MMISDPSTLYKLMILYLLRKASLPMTEDRISDFFLSHEYTTWFSLKSALSELTEVGFIRSETTVHSTRYSITEKGNETYNLFVKNISPEITADMDKYLNDNRIELRNEVSISADYYRSTGQEYIVRCRVSEGRLPLISLELAVPDEVQAELMCSHWRNSQEDIYTFVMQKLLCGD